MTMFSYADLNVTQVLGICAFSLFLCYVIYKWVQTRNYPPGPIGLPFLGYWPFLGKSPPDTLWKLSKKYGDIFSFYIGRKRMVCVTDYRMAKEILSHQVTLARPPHSFDFLVGKAGFGGLSGEEWQEQRRFALLTMRNLGMGKGLWETMIQECASDLVKEIQKKNGKPFHHDHLLSISQINNSLSLLFGRRLDMEKEKDKIEITHKMSEFMMEAFAATNITFNDPSFAPLLLLFNYKKITEGMKTLRKSEGIFEKEIKMRLQSKDDQLKEDFIGCFLQEMEKRNKTNQPHTFTLENLQGNMFLLYNAGQDSTLASVGWLLLLMSGHPDIQAKVCAEIDRTIGRDGVVYYDDRVNLPYTLATVYEMMRYITINPIFPPRYTLEDFEYGGYTIPKGSHIICNSWALLHDPRYHEDPMEFKPERFLTENGTKLKRMDGYGPFSFGKRNCPGEGVAMMTTYLYFVNIMQKFNIKTPTGGPPDMTYKYSAGTRPVAQNLCFIER